MSFLDGIFNNPAIRNAALGQLAKIIKSENLDFIEIRLDPDGGIIVNMYKPGEAVVLPVEIDGPALIESPEKPIE